MWQVDPFEHLVPGVEVRVDVGEKRVVQFVVEAAEPSLGRILLRPVDDSQELDPEVFVDWRVYMVSCNISGAAELTVPNDFKELRSSPPRLGLEVLDGAEIIQRRLAHRAAGDGLCVRRRGATASEEVVNLSIGGVALSTQEAPPPHGSTIDLDLVAGSQVLGLRGQIVGSVKSDREWQWRIRFDELSDPVHAAMLAIIHHEERAAAE